MSEAKHTPGPWRVGERQDMTHVIRDRRSQPVSVTEGEGLIDGLERRANARLIAAAPDMLEALEGLIEAHNLGYPTIEAMNKAIDDAEKVAFDAIAKAKGEA